MSFGKNNAEFTMMAGSAMQIATKTLEIHLRDLNFILRGKHSVHQTKPSEEGIQNDKIC